MLLRSLQQCVKQSTAEIAVFLTDTMNKADLGLNSYPSGSLRHPLAGGCCLLCNYSVSSAEGSSPDTPCRHE